MTVVHEVNFIISGVSVLKLFQTFSKVFTKTNSQRRCLQRNACFYLTLSLQKSATCSHYKNVGAHHKGRVTIPYSCHVIFTDRSIFSLNQSPSGTSVTNHKHGLNFLNKVIVSQEDKKENNLRSAHVDRNCILLGLLVTALET